MEDLPPVASRLLVLGRGRRPVGRFFFVAIRQRLAGGRIVRRQIAGGQQERRDEGAGPQCQLPHDAAPRSGALSSPRARTTAPVTSEAGGLRTTASPGSRPVNTSTKAPKSRPSVTGCSTTWPSGPAVATPGPSARNNSALAETRTPRSATGSLKWTSV